MNNNNHIILYYKGDISALTLFCQQQDGNICFPPLPKLSSFIEEEEQKPLSIDLRPTELIKKVNQQLQLDDDLLVAEPGFCQQVETPKGIEMIYMARFKVLDPPHHLLAASNCKLQPLTALVGRMPAEMDLLRSAYIQLMEG